MKLVGRLLLVLVATVLVVFSATNQAMVTIDLWPVPRAFDTPLFIVFLGALFAGVLAGAVLFWFPARLWKRRAMKRARRITELEAEIEKTALPQSASITGASITGVLTKSARLAGPAKVAMLDDD